MNDYIRHNPRAKTMSGGPHFVDGNSVGDNRNVDLKNNAAHDNTSASARKSGVFVTGSTELDLFLDGSAMWGPVTLAPPPLTYSSLAPNASLSARPVVGRNNRVGLPLASRD